MEWGDFEEEDQSAFAAAMGTPEDARAAWKTVAKVLGIGHHSAGEPKTL